MKIWMAVVMMISSSATAIAADLPRSKPSEQNVSPAAILSFMEAIDKLDAMNSFMLVRHGHVIAEGWWAPYRPESRHSLYSLSKSFTSTAVGLAIEEGKLRIDDEVVKFFPDDVPKEPSEFLKSMRVSDLLRMSTGHVTEPPRKPTEVWTKTFLHHPVPFKPGTHFLYNTSATYMLSAIVQKVTEQTVLDYLGPRLFEPLGIENPTWEVSPQGISTGGYGLSIRTEDIAKFGQLYLQKGKWNEKQLVPAEWVEKATALQTSNGSNPQSDWDQGYGYQFWRSRHHAYRGDGAFGQYVIVLPELDAVVAITSGVKDMQAVLNVVWDELLPAFDSAASSSSAQARLDDKLKSLTVALPKESESKSASHPKAFEFAPNDLQLESLTFMSSDGVDQIKYRLKGEDHEIKFGSGEWRDGVAAWGALKRQPIAAARSWNKNVFTGKICFYETPFIVTLELSFEGDQVAVASFMNVGFGDVTEPRRATGKIK